MDLVPVVKIVSKNGFVLLPVLLVAVLLSYFFLEVSKSHELSSFIALHNKNNQKAFNASQQMLDYVERHQIPACFVENANWRSNVFWQQLPRECHPAEYGYFFVEQYVVHDSEENNEENQDEIFFRVTTLGQVHNEKVILQAILRPHERGHLAWRRLV